MCVDAGVATLTPSLPFCCRDKGELAPSLEDKVVRVTFTELMLLSSDNLSIEFRTAVLDLRVVELYSATALSTTVLAPLIGSEEKSKELCVLAFSLGDILPSS
mmetsp:Transcript_24114/g.35064  ORF Transcript_24114/g.35064 Transcript_24114/m.35064 type:complete len:103 (+) Transcript_24114:1186-1494(+)